jgi:hypothetical protein
VLDKNQTGSTEYGLIHSVYEVRLAHAPGGRKLARLAQSWPKGQVCPVQGLCVVCVCVCVCVCVWVGGVVCVCCVCVCVCCASRCMAGGSQASSSAPLAASGQPG